MRGNTLQLERIGSSEQTLCLSAIARARHLYVCGGTGVGKSKLVEHCLRQDILNWKASKCGLLLLDPHGLVYRNTMAWLARHDLKRPVIPIELHRDDWIVSYNMLRQRTGADSAVVVSNFVRALSHVWGESGTDRTPLFARLAGAILLTLYQNGYSVADFPHLLYREDIRRAMVANVKDHLTRVTWQLAQKHPKEFDQQISSTLNRFNRLIGPKVMQATFGQPDVSLDLLSAIEDGAIILVDLSTQGGKIEEEDANTFATLLLTDLWAAAKLRSKHEKQKPSTFTSTSARSSLRRRSLKVRVYRQEVHHRYSEGGAKIQAAVGEVLEHQRLVCGLSAAGAESAIKRSERPRFFIVASAAPPRGWRRRRRIRPARPGRTSVS